VVQIASVLTILGDERIVGGGEIDEPIPITALVEQDGGRVQRVGHHGRSPVGDKFGTGDDLDVAKPGVDRVSTMSVRCSTFLSPVRKGTRSWA
jgi:hypothetical protein